MVLTTVVDARVAIVSTWASDSETARGRGALGVRGARRQLASLVQGAILPVFPFIPAPGKRLSVRLPGEMAQAPRRNPQIIRAGTLGPEHKIRGIGVDRKKARVKRPMVESAKHDPVSGIVGSLFLLWTQVCSFEYGSNCNTAYSACRSISFQDAELESLLVRTEGYFTTLF
jgi:hypothetical protein